MIGNFSVYNVLVVIVISFVLYIFMEKVIKIVESILGVKGCFEFVYVG